jgi:hypothetical protein
MKSHINESVNSNIGKEMFYILAGDKSNVKDSKTNKSIIKEFNDYCKANNIKSLKSFYGPYIIPMHAIKNSTAWDDGFINPTVFKHDNVYFYPNADRHNPEGEDGYIFKDIFKSNKISYQGFVTEYYIGLQFGFYEKIKGEYEMTQSATTFFYFKEGTKPFNNVDFFVYKMENEYFEKYDIY